MYCGTYFTTVLLKRLVDLLGQSGMVVYKAEVVCFTEKTPLEWWTTETDP